MSIFDYHDYRRFLRDWIRAQPRNGYGVLSRWAKVMRVSTPLLSQVLQGKKSLTHEMVEALSREIGLVERELDYFLLLIDHDRAGTVALKSHFRKKITEAQLQARQLKNRVQNVTELSAEARAIYYSSWFYSGLRNWIACVKNANPDTVAEHFGLPRPVILQVSEFLLQHGLLVEGAKGLEVGPQSTYISPESPLAKKHHQNWRIKAMQTMDQASEEDLFYTSPMSLSAELALRLRRRLVDVIQEIQKDIRPSSSEVVRCLSIDFFEY